MVTKDNFYRKTKGEWKLTISPDREPDYTSESGSSYWYTSEGIYRLSDHWGIVSSCYWRINKKDIHINVCGYIEWGSLEPYDTVEIKSEEIIIDPNYLHFDYMIISVSDGYEDSWMDMETKMVVIKKDDILSHGMSSHFYYDYDEDMDEYTIKVSGKGTIDFVFVSDIRKIEQEGVLLYDGKDLRSSKGDYYTHVYYFFNA